VTRIDTQPGHEVDAGLAVFDDDSDLVEADFERAAAHSCFGLWLALVDVQIDTLPGRRRLAWNWPAACSTGPNLRAATFAVSMSGEADTAPAPSMNQVGSPMIVTR